MERYIQPIRQKTSLQEMNPNRRPRNVLILRPDQTIEDYIQQELKKLNSADISNGQNPNLPLSESKPS